MTWLIGRFIKLLVWVIALMIFLGFFNPLRFSCSHSMFWGDFVSLCSVTTAAEGMVSVIFLALSINHRLHLISVYLVLCLLFIVVLEWLRSGFGIQNGVQILESYSWKLWGIIFGLIFAKDWFNPKNYFVLIFIVSFIGIYFREEIDTGIIKLFLWLAVFVFFAFLINRIRAVGWKRRLE